jgi:hypothetical protein
VDRLIESGVPFHLQEGLVEYFAARRPVGGFLTAVLRNDLMDACLRAADEETATHLVHIIRFLVNYVPADAWGSQKAVDAWLAAHPAPVQELYE